MINNKHALIFKCFSLLLALNCVPNFRTIDFSQASEIAIPREVSNKIIGVRIDDLVDSYPSLIPGLPNINVILKKYPEGFFNVSKIESVLDVFLTKMPEINGEMVTLNLAGFVKYKRDFYTFEKVSVTYDIHAKSLHELAILNDVIYALNDMSFQINVGLVDRKVIIKDVSKNIKMVFPIGVGAFDVGVMNEGIVSLVTPRFKHGFVDKSVVISKREKPRYFAGKPFIRILKGEDVNTDRTAIGFHLEINESFVRGFDSHGCMRLREADLMTFHDLIMFGDEQQTPLTIDYRTRDLADHPATKRNTTYKTILNKGTEASPFFIYDRDNLVQMTYVTNGQAPIERLYDQAGDNYYDLLSYDTDKQIQEQDARRKNECDQRVMRGELPSTKKYQECLDEGKRKDSLADRIYRKYMGIDEPTPTPSSNDDVLF